MEYTGGCQCGQVRYRVTAAPLRTVTCHCKECQRQSGSAFGMSMIVSGESLKLTGELKQYTRIADSGNENTGFFCPDCGVRIFQQIKGREAVVVIKPGTLDETSWLRPTDAVWLKRKQDWVSVPDRVQHAEAQPA
ncbi:MULTISPECIES: GFA family protein [Paraburkholderia]|uniref:GFA family protein n=1 Tax=Paraburkholderia TaxID=1822464 RepID=UPI0022555BF4|nr:MULTISPECIES: GFA family protein [Paraburkholderia]MCX4174520.1 GFA family protein [Paraburkholderia madseniana]